SIESIRKEIEGRSEIREKISVSIDLPISPQSKNILNYAAEESERMAHRTIGTEHLLLGMLREEAGVAAEILFQRGLILDKVRDELARSAPKQTLTEGVRNITDMGRAEADEIISQWARTIGGFKSKAPLPG